MCFCFCCCCAQRYSSLFVVNMFPFISTPPSPPIYCLEYSQSKQEYEVHDICTYGLRILPRTNFLCNGRVQVRTRTCSFLLFLTFTARVTNVPHLLSAPADDQNKFDIFVSVPDIVCGHYYARRVGSGLVWSLKIDRVLGRVGPENWPETRSPL